MPETEINIGDTVPSYPDVGKVKEKTLVNLFTGPCSVLNNSGPFTGFDTRLVKSDDKAEYLTHLLNQGWYPVDPDNFALPGRLIELKIARAICPHYFHAGLRVHFRVTFREGFTPAEIFTNVAPVQDIDFVWTRGTSLNVLVTSNPVPTPLPGDNGPWQARIEIEPVVNESNCLVTLRFRGTLVSGGWYYLSGGRPNGPVVVHDVNVGCGGFVGLTGFGTGLAFGWDAVGPNSHPNPILAPILPLQRGLEVGVSANGFVD